MAPKPRRSPLLELREPELPRPLRIIKRGQTIAGGLSSRESEYVGRGFSAGSEDSRGSPPMTIDRPLTVHKRRGGRGSIPDGSFEESVSSITGTGSAISDLIKKSPDRTLLEDPDLTPKADRQIPRTISAGAFLKSELHTSRSKHASDSTEHIQLSQLDGQGTRISPPEIPERRLSRSKTFFFKLGGRKEKEPKSVHSQNSTSSKNTLTRRLSQKINRKSGSDTTYTGSIASADSTYSLQEANSKDIADVTIYSRISSYGSDSIHSISPGSMQVWGASAREEFILCPEITITPEASSVDAGSTNLWVAIEITGSLRLASNCERSLSHLPEGRRTISGHSAAHLRNFGRLSSMRVELITTRDASVLEVIGNLHELKTVCAGETHLVLTKLRISKVTKATSHIRESSTSDEIMADLENHLGGAVTSYLTVRLKYKHSGFLNYNRKTIDWEGGTSSHTSNLQTEASAYIKRHNLESLWSPRVSGEMNGPLELNPIVKLIEMHLPSDKARNAIRRLANDRVPIPMAKRPRNASDTLGESDDTVQLSVGSNIAARIDSAVSSTLLQSLSNDSLSEVVPSDPAPPVSHFLKNAAESDPARKIWAQMRRNSRGPRNYRTSISDGHYSNDLNDCSPSRLDSTDTIGEERIKIRDLALRNKRSVGADTLKSFAPSIGKGKNSTIGGLGLGVGRNWWVNSNWW